MAVWVNPTTWADGAQVTKQQFLDWNASMACVGDHTGWSTWSPDLYSQTSGTGIEVGSDGTKIGRKMKVGKLALCTFDCSFGTTANGATWIVQAGGGVRLPALMPLPWAASTGTGRVAAGWGYAYRADTDDTFLLTPAIYSNVFAFYRATVAGTSTGAACATSNWPIPPGAGTIVGARFSGVLVYRTNT